MLGAALAQGVENRSAADAEAQNGSQGGDQHDVCAEVDDVGDDRCDSEKQSQDVEPEWGVDVGGRVPAKTQLQQESSESDGCDYHQGEWAGEGGMAGINHDQREREEQQSGGNDAPASRFGRGTRIGCDVRQGVSSKVIQGGRPVFQTGQRLVQSSNLNLPAAVVPQTQATSVRQRTAVRRRAGCGWCRPATQPGGGLRC